MDANDTAMYRSDALSGIGDMAFHLTVDLTILKGQ
jgi:hypothetical protein